MRIDVKRARRGLLKRNQWVAVVSANNGKKLFKSETYNNKAEAVHAADLLTRGEFLIVVED